MKMYSRGYTLIELLITMTIFIFATLIFSRFFIAEHHIYSVQEADTEMHQTLRNVLNMVSRELMLTGYGLPSGRNGITEFKEDAIEFRTNLRDITSSLSDGANPDQSILIVLNGTGRSFKKGDVIEICDNITTHRCEEHTLSDNGTDNSITIASSINDPFAAGSRIDLINTISYRYNGSKREFQRKIDRGTWESVAENIPADGLIFSYKDRFNNTPENSSDICRVDIILTVESIRIDEYYQDNNGYRRTGAKSTITLRNYL
jgi:type II secretory pathway pseudopilin PulG